MSATSLGAVLILEDDPGVSRLQRKTLERAGYAVFSSATTEEALEKIQAGGIDLIVLDYSLSGAVSGVEFYRRLQIAGYNLPAILVTGFSDEARLIEALRAGVRDFLPKTADFIDYLAPTVERVMRQVRAERKAVESEELRQKEQRFRTSVENMLDCFGIYSAVRDAAGQIVDFRADYVNAAASGSTAPPRGADGESAAAGSLFLGKALFEQCARVVESARPFSVDGFKVSDLGGPEGSEARWFDIRISKLGDGFVATWRDVSARIKYEVELARARLRAEQASRAKDEFLATVSHELRTPLNAILGWVQLLGMADLDDETKQDAVLTIERNAKSQARLIEDLIDISRIVSGKLRLEVRQADLRAIIHAAIDAARPAAEARSLRLDVALDPAAGTISGDPDRLQQVVWNLISNAIKFTPEGGQVNVALRWAGNGVEIAVRDTGKGIDPAFLPFVFERFSQADSSSTRHYSGLGLGLAITRHLVELHGGAIEAASEGEGRGSIFTVRLPLNAVPAAGAQPAQEPAAAAVVGERSLTNLPRELEGITVVAVDDDADARHLLQTVLTYCKASATVVSTADAAFEAVRRLRPDVLLSDIEMAGEDGYSLIRRVRALEPEAGGDTPAAAMTAYARKEDRARALQAGFQLHVSKPVEAVELVAVVSKLARREAVAIGGSAAE